MRSLECESIPKTTENEDGLGTGSGIFRAGHPGCDKTLNREKKGQSGKWNQVIDRRYPVTSFLDIRRLPSRNVTIESILGVQVAAKECQNETAAEFPFDDRDVRKLGQEDKDRFYPGLVQRGGKVPRVIG